MNLRTNFYIDGFNFYYGSLKGTPHKWLDVAEFCRRSFPAPRNVLHQIRYFTALVKARPAKPDQPDKQQRLLRALRLTPDLTVHLGTYLDSQPTMRLVHPPPGGPALVRVHKSEEKGSDVNLASYLLVDAFRGRFDVAVVVSNDSDLVEPIRLVRAELGKPVLVLFPCTNPGRRESVDLKKVALTSKLVDPTILAACRLPDELTDAGGTFQKPADW